MPPRLAFAFAFVAAGCGRDPAVLALDVGRETAALSAAPTPVRWEVGFTGSAARVLAGQGDWPSSGLDVDLKSDEVGAFDVAFTDSSGTSLAMGESPAVVVGELPGRRLPLFVQRRGTFARPTADLDPRARPVLTVVGGRILVVGGGDLTLGAFDLALVQPLSPQSLQSAPDALAATKGAIFSTTGGALARLDLETAAISTVALPSAVNGAELAAAPLVARAGGFAWVGPARNTGASSAIVFVDADETMRVARLPAHERGCTAAPLSDGALTLVCATGSWHAAADGSVSAAPFPSLDSVAALSVLDDGTQHAVASGHAYRVAAGCDSACIPADLGAVPCTARAQLVGLGAESLLLCDDADGASRALRLQAGPPVPVELREARSGATLVALSRREAAVVGGGPSSFERYRPR